MLKGEAIFDHRLFSAGAVSSAAAAAHSEENIFQKPLFAGLQSSIYVPRGGAEASGEAGDLERSSRGFAGANARSGAGPRSRPVEFEKNEEDGVVATPPVRAPSSANADGKEDMLERFLKKAKVAVEESKQRQQ